MPETGNNSAPLATEFRKWQVEELTTVRWARPGYEYYTVGRLTREQMDSIDEKFR